MFIVINAKQDFYKLILILYYMEGITHKYRINNYEILFQTKSSIWT